MAYTRAQLDRWKAEKNREIKAQEREKTRLNGEIERLEKAYDKIIELKDYDAETLKSKTKAKNATSGYEWRGATKNKFDGVFDEDAYPDSKKLIKDDLDRVADDILWAINKKKGEVDSSTGIIKACKNTISYIGTLYNTLTN